MNEKHRDHVKREWRKADQEVGFRADDKARGDQHVCGLCYSPEDGVLKGHDAVQGLVLLHRQDHSRNGFCGHVFHTVSKARRSSLIRRK